MNVPRCTVWWSISSGGWTIKKWTRPARVAVAGVLAFVGINLFISTQAEKQGPKSFFPDAEKRRRILKRFDEAWERGEPFSAHHNAEAEGRYAVRLLMDEFGYRRNEAKEILQAWMFEGRFLKTDVRDAHTKMRGLRVTSI